MNAVCPTTCSATSNVAAAKRSSARNAPTNAREALDEAAMRAFEATADVQRAIARTYEQRLDELSRHPPPGP
jgi:acyl-CoA reductase-like NAD-dependent aldehyde dehydrogenase